MIRSEWSDRTVELKECILQDLIYTATCIGSPDVCSPAARPRQGRAAVWGEVETSVKPCQEVQEYASIPVAGVADLASAASLPSFYGRLKYA